MSQFSHLAFGLATQLLKSLLLQPQQRRSVPPTGHQSCHLIIKSGLLTHRQASEQSQDKPWCLQTDISIVTRVPLAIRANYHLSYQHRLDDKPRCPTDTRHLARQTLQPKSTGNRIVQTCPQKGTMLRSQGAPAAADSATATATTNATDRSSFVEIEPKLAEPGHTNRTHREKLSAIVTSRGPQKVETYVGPLQGT